MFFFTNSLLSTFLHVFLFLQKFQRNLIAVELNGRIQPEKKKYSLNIFQKKLKFHDILTQKLDIRFLILYPISKEECTNCKKKSFLNYEAKSFAE